MNIANMHYFDLFTRTLTLMHQCITDARELQIHDPRLIKMAISHLCLGKLERVFLKLEFSTTLPLSTFFIPIHVIYLR